jgi:ribosomal protein L30/L7E
MINIQNMPMIEMMQKYDSVSIIGMNKNVGKTTTLNHILREARGRISLGLTSIGRDGEEQDLVTATEKPKIYIEKGTIIATAKQCLFNSDITREILKTTGFNTPMGEIIICRALSDGYVDLGGPSVNSYMTSICDELKRFGSQLVIVDGALNRKTFASPSITDATILSTGAALSRSMIKVIEETRHTAQLLSLGNENDTRTLKLAKEILRIGRIGIIRRDNTIKMLDVLTALGSSKEIVGVLDGNTTCVVIKGVVSDKLLEDIMALTNGYKGVTFLVEDGTKVFLTRDIFYKFKKQGGVIKTINKINIVCVTSNPKSPYGYEFDKHKFLDGLRNNLNVPVFDVIGGE